MYTLLFESSVFGRPAVRHPMYDYPENSEIVKNEDSFLLGKAIRVTANFDLSSEPAEFTSVFGEGIWVDYIKYERLTVTTKNQTLNLYNGWDYTNLHIKGGSIVPFQATGEGSGVKTTADLHEIPINLIIVPDEVGYAEGTVFLAKGEYIEESYQYFKLIHANNVIQFNLESGDISNDERIQEIHILGDEKVLEADTIKAIDFDQNVIPMKIKISHSEFTHSFLNLTSEDGGSIQMSRIQSITYGKATPMKNSYQAVITTDLPAEISYELSLKTSDNDANKLLLSAKIMSDHTVHVKITDNSNKRFEVPKEALNMEGPEPTTNRDIHNFVSITEDPFTLTVHEYNQPKNAYLKIDDDSIAMQEYYLSLKTQVNTDGRLYGVGERIKEFFIPEGIYTTWARDIPDPYDDGQRPGKNIYGSHPVYFTRAKSGSKYHWGMLNLNANAQDTEIKYTGSLGGEISHYITGQGIFDLYFFLDNEKPEHAVKEYHDLIGYPLLPPFFALGWNQCRYGYKNTQELREVVQNYTAADFPLDTIWSDIDYMYKYRDFTYDKDGEYKGLDTFIKEDVHAKGKYYVPILDGGMAVVNDDSYPAFTRGLNQGAYILSGNAKSDKGLENVFVGKVWPGYAAYPDFTNEKTNKWWKEELKSFYSEIQFDGLWLDMNEASNFCSGGCLDKDRVPMSESVISKLTYTPGVNKLEDKSMSLDAKHSDGQLELNHHSLFGFLQGIPSYQYFEENNKRAFIISRSTFVGQGKYTSHWLGDNYSGFDHLRQSVAGIYSMNLYGINFVGSDICGFMGNTNENLCQKWTLVGAFYPFSRNHNAIGSVDQEPYRFSEETQDNMRRAIRWRYALLRYYYTQMYINSIEGGMFWKPLFFEFPEDPKVYSELDSNIMIGSALKLSAYLDEKDQRNKYYIFPEGVWCDIAGLTTANVCTKYYETTNAQLSAAPDALHLHLRMGHILPLQPEATQDTLSSKDLDQIQTSLLILLDTNTAEATGRLMVDDGITLKNPQRLDVEFKFSLDPHSSSFDPQLNLSESDVQGTLRFDKHSTFPTASGTKADKLNKVTFLGTNYAYSNKEGTKDLRIQFNKARVNDREYEGIHDSSFKTLEFNFEGLDMNSIDIITFTA